MLKSILVKRAETIYLEQIPADVHLAVAYGRLDRASHPDHCGIGRQ